MQRASMNSSHDPSHDHNPSFLSFEQKHQGSNSQVAFGNDGGPAAQPGADSASMAEKGQTQHGNEQGGTAADAPAGPSQPYAYGFWDKELAGMRKEYLVNLLRIVILICVLIWGIVTIYWGSLWKSSELSPNIHGWVINRDPTGAVGQNLTNAILASNSRPPPRLTWVLVSPEQYPTMAELDKAIAVDQKTWVAIEILQDATARLDAARSNPSANQWPAASAITVTYAEARNQQAVDGVILGATRGLLHNIVPQIERASVAQWLASNANNAAALSALATAAPETLSNPLGIAYNNLRPWNLPVAIAPTFVGLIYVMILAFNITMGNFGIRQGIQRKLRLRSLIMMRIFAPIACYVVLSCMFSLINVPFKLSFGAMGYGYGAGFMVWWCFTFLGMCVLGLATEAALALVTMRFVGFFLVFFIIINVSVANLPIELQVSLFKYGYAMPFYNLKQAYIAIVFNVGRHVELLKFMGILLAWLAVLFLTLPIWIWLERRSEQKAMRQQGGGGAPPNTSAPAAAVSHSDSEKDAKELNRAHSPQGSEAA